MTATQNTASATLIVEETQCISLPHVAEVLCMTLEASGTSAVCDVDLTTLTVESAGMSLTMRLAFIQDETKLSVTLRDDDAASTETVLARLAPLTFALAVQLPVSHVIWADTDLRIPRDTFVKGLADQFGAVQAKTDDCAQSETNNVTKIAPRRIKPSGAQVLRPDLAHVDPKIAKLLPVVDSGTLLQAANKSSAISEHRFDAHVFAYQADMRKTLLRDASEEELKAVEAERGPIPVEVRLSTWAVSLSVATISLPVAVPVMAYNVARGEDMRVASLAMGLAGFFMTLSSSGAMASISF